MSKLVMLAVLYGGALAQSFFGAISALGHVACPVLPALCVYYALTRRRGEALLAAFAAGLLQDSLSLAPLGMSSLIFCLVARVLNGYRHEVFVTDRFAHMVFGAVANFVITVLTAVLLWRNGVALGGAAALTVKLAGSLALGGLVVPVVFIVADALYTRLGFAGTEKLI